MLFFKYKFYSKLLRKLPIGSTITVIRYVRHIKMNRKEEIIPVTLELAATNRLSNVSIKQIAKKREYENHRYIITSIQKKKSSLRCSNI